MPKIIAENRGVFMGNHRFKENHLNLDAYDEYSGALPPKAAYQ